MLSIRMESEKKYSSYSRQMNPKCRQPGRHYNSRLWSSDSIALRVRQHNCTKIGCESDANPNYAHQRMSSSTTEGRGNGHPEHPTRVAQGSRLG
jgi:hypothetical protein